MPVRPPRRSSSVVSLTLLFARLDGSPALAWGRIGHRLISRITEKHLTPEVKAAIAALLEPGESLADASMWADENRDRLPKTAPWHYVDVPLDEPRYDPKFSGDVSSKGCMVNKINEFKLTVKDPSKSVEDRRFTLRFLIHCVKDLHMPMHVGDNGDKGGNLTQVRFYARGTNMHALWDSIIIEQLSKSEKYWLEDLAELDTAENRATWMKETAEGLCNREPAGRPRCLTRPCDRLETQARHDAGRCLPREESARRRRLCQAGFRLAMLLNVAFPAMR